MGNEESSTGGRDSHTVSSLGDYSNRGSFGSAFNAAHKAGGSGHTFTYQGKLYNTNCADGGDYRKTPDTRTVIQHQVHEFGHNVNAHLKDDLGINALDKIPFYGRDKSWSSDIDRQRSEYHRREAEKKSKK